MVKQNWYVADFETTSYRFYSENGYTKVWLYAICDSNGEVVDIGSNIGQFMDWCKAHNNALVYFHNLKFDGSFILYWCLENNLKYEDKLLVHDKRAFTTLIGDMGEFYQIKINFSPNHQVTFQDSLKIIPLKVKVIAKSFNLPIEKEVIDYDKYEINKDTISYVSKDVQIVSMALRFFREQGFNKMTIGSNAYRQYVNEYDLAKHMFPRLDRDWLEEWRTAYRGGRSQVNPRFAGKVINGVRRYDINSMYPTMMAYMPMPYGKPIECVKPGMFEFEMYDIDIDFNLKTGHLPTLLKSQSMYIASGDSYYTDSKGVLNLKISNVDLELMYRHYDIIYIKYNKILGFKTSKSMFTKFINKYYELKSTSEGGLRLVYKLILNNLYGKFGSRPRGKNKSPALLDGRITYVLGEEHDMSQYYLPVAVAVTSFAHKMIDDAIMTTGYNNFVYCDTDSIHTLGELPEDMVDSKELGKFKLEGIEEVSKYIRQKCYIYKENGNWEVTCAGMPDSIKDYLVREHGEDIVNVFNIGLKINENSPNIRASDMKLSPVQVKGGCVLKPIGFSLN